MFRLEVEVCLLNKRELRYCFVGDLEFVIVFVFKFECVWVLNIEF